MYTRCHRRPIARESEDTSGDIPPLSLHPYFLSLPRSVPYRYIFSLSRVRCVYLLSLEIDSLRTSLSAPPSDGFCSLPSSRSSTCTIPSPSQISFYVRPPSASASASVQARRNVPLFFFLPSLPHTPPSPSWRNEANRFPLCEKVGRFGICGRFGHGGKGGRGGQIMTRCVINNPPSIQSTHYNRGNEEAPPPFQGRGGEAK